jgi:hypothetical protein
MNETTFKAEIGQCLSWAEYANDMTCFDYYDARVCPLDSEYFSVSEIKALYHYCCYKGINEDNILTYVYPDIALVWMDNNDSMLGVGTTLVEAYQDFMATLEHWYNQNCDRL